MAITKKDIEKLSSIFVTKSDFKDGLNNGLNSVKFELTNQILTSQDKIMKKLEDLSIEQKMGRLESRRHEDRLEDHEKRIKVLEAAS
ncbi:MAG: hypothetical protein ABH823_03295 [bacterium]